MSKKRRNKHKPSQNSQSSHAPAQRFRDRYKNLTDIGRALGLSARDLGTKLKELGLRDADGAPAAGTLEQGLAAATPLKNGTPHYMWDKRQVMERLRQNGVTPDPEAREALHIRESVSEILRLIESEEFEMGGGFAYKVAVDVLFEDLLPKLPLPEKLREVRAAIHKTKAGAEAKEYALELASYRCAESPRLNEATALYLIEKEDDWQVMELLAKRSSLSEETRELARQKLLASAPPAVAQGHQEDAA